MCRHGAGKGKEAESKKIISVHISLYMFCESDFILFLSVFSANLPVYLEKGTYSLYLHFPYQIGIHIQLRFGNTFTLFNVGSTARPCVLRVRVHDLAT